MEEILKQFDLDVPRIDLSLEGLLCKETPNYVKDYLYQKLDKNAAEAAIYLLTQTFLASFYIEEYKRRRELGEHLLDNSKYEVNINTNDKYIQLTKDFKIVYFYEEDDYYLVDYCTLNIYLDLKKMELIYNWNYEFCNNDIYITKINW